MMVVRLEITRTSFCTKKHSLLVELPDLPCRPTDQWPGGLMSPTGCFSGLTGSHTHLRVLWSFGCHWTLPGSRGSQRRAVGGPTVTATASSSSPTNRGDRLKNKFCFIYLSMQPFHVFLSVITSPSHSKLKTQTQREGTGCLIGLISESHYPFSAVHLCVSSSSSWTPHESCKKWGVNFYAKS